MEGKSHRANKNTIIRKVNGLIIFAALTTTIILSYAYVGYTQEEDGWGTGESYSVPNSGMDMSTMDISTIDTAYYMPPTTDYKPTATEYIPTTDFSSMSMGSFNQPGVVPSIPTFSGSVEEGIVPSLPAFPGYLEEVGQEIVFPDKSTILSQEFEKMPDKPAPQPQPGIYPTGKGKDVYIIPEDTSIYKELKIDEKGRKKWADPVLPQTQDLPVAPPPKPSFFERIFGGDKKK